ncbi:MAG: hypothetical protein IH944_08120 [Armatimonadetes bacterium]|nr:hypothetical protein [Armatimonadota bacterium]
MANKTSIWERILVGEFDFGDVAATLLRAYCLPVLVVVLAFLPNSGIILLDTFKFILLMVGIAAFVPTAWYLASLGPRLLRWITIAVGLAFALLGAFSYLWYALGGDLPAQYKTIPTYFDQVFVPLVAVSIAIGWIVVPFRLRGHRRSQAEVVR